jgi:hypothetical protein
MWAILRRWFLAVGLAVAVGNLGCETPARPTPLCVVSVSPSTASFPSEGGGGAVNVIASAESCTWTTGASAAWLTLGSGPSGVGSASVLYSVSANTETSPRSGTILVNDVPHLVTQAGRVGSTCVYHLQPSSASFDHNGGTGRFVIETGADCPWTARPSASWLSVTAGSGGSGPGTVSYRVDETSDEASRSAGIVVVSAVFSVMQVGEPPQPVACDYTVAPVSFTPCLTGGTLVARMDTQSSCSWTATSSVPWLTMRLGSSGSGPGEIRFDYTDNYDAPRTGVVMVRWPTITAGQNVHVAQAGCRYAVSRSSIPIGAPGGSSSFDVYQQAEPNQCGGPLQDACVWSAVADVSWIAITTPMPRAGDQRVSFVVQPNTTGLQRGGTIKVRTESVRIDQAAN